MALNIKPILNVNGEARIELAIANGGLGKITHIAIGRGQFHPTGTEIGLFDEVARTAIETVTPQGGHVEVTGTITCPEDFTAGELAFLLEDGTPFSVWSEDPALQYPDLDPVTGVQREDGNGNPITRAGMPLATLREGTEVPFRYVIDVDVYGPDKVTISPMPLNEAYTLQGVRLELIENALANPKFRTLGNWALQTLTLYVDPATGDDSNDGLSWASAKRTPLGAWWTLTSVPFHNVQIILKAGVHRDAPVDWDADVFHKRPGPLHLSGRVCGPRTTRDPANNSNLSGVVFRGENEVMIDGNGEPIVDATTAIIEAAPGGYGFYATGSTRQVGAQDFVIRPRPGENALGLFVAQRNTRVQAVRVFGLGEGRVSNVCYTESGGAIEGFDCGMGGGSVNNWVAYADSRISLVVEAADPLAGVPALVEGTDFLGTGLGAEISINTTENGFKVGGKSRFSDAAKATFRGRVFGDFPQIDTTLELRSNAHANIFYAHQAGDISLDGGVLTVQDGALEAPVYNDGGKVVLGNTLRVTVDLPKKAAITCVNGGLVVDTGSTTIWTGTAAAVRYSENDPGGIVAVTGDGWFINCGDVFQHLDVSGGTASRTGILIGHSTFTVQTVAAGFQANEDVLIGGNVIGTVQSVDGAWITIRMKAATPVIATVGPDLTGASSAHVSAMTTVNPLTAIGRRCIIEGRSWPLTFDAAAYQSGAVFTLGNGVGEVRSSEFRWDGAEWRRLNWDKT